MAKAATAKKAPAENVDAGADRPLLDLNNDAVKKMIRAAKKRGYVTVDELNAVMPSEEVSPDQIEDTMSMLSEMGINVVEEEETEEAAENAEEAAEEEAYSYDWEASEISEEMFTVNNLWIMIAGMLVFAIVWLLTTALTLGDASVVVPLANMGFVAAFVFSVVLRLERLDARKLSAVALAVVAVVLLAQAG